MSKKFQLFINEPLIMSVFVSFISFGILLNNVALSVELDRKQPCSILLGPRSPQSF